MSVIVNVDSINTYEAGQRIEVDGRKGTVLRVWAGDRAMLVRWATTPSGG